MILSLAGVFINGKVAETNRRREEHENELEIRMIRTEVEMLKKKQKKCSYSILGRRY